MPKIRLDQQAAPDSVRTELIKNLEIRQEDLADGAVTAEKIAPGAISTTLIADNSVTASKLKIDSDLSFDYNQLKDVRIENLNSLPPAGYPGRLVYVQPEKVLYYDDGFNWIKLNVNITLYKVRDLFIILDEYQYEYQLTFNVLRKSEEVYLNGVRLVYGSYNDYVIENERKLVLNSNVELNVNGMLVVEYFNKDDSRYLNTVFEKNSFILQDNQYNVTLPYDILAGTEKVSLNGISLVNGQDYVINGKEITLNNTFEIYSGMILYITYMIG